MTENSPKIQDISLEKIMGDRFARYSKSIIQERALPDIRDGLKPVQRRILYSMFLDGNTYDKGFRKSAKGVGNVMGNFHPHGDSSIYEAMVRLSQDWKLRNPLIEMHGNNGSMDGDPPAAMRYTEARLSKISTEMLRDINKDTVDEEWNFDDTEKEPKVLPARFPNLLVNGATGISAGYATEIPPHNLGEVIDATIKMIDNPDITLDELMKIVKGPDFPTGGILQGKQGIKDAYTNGRGRVYIRSKTSIQEIRGHKSQIVITEIPYEVNKAQLVKKMDEIRVLKKVEGIAEVRDESDRQGLSIVVELKRDVDANGILNYLFKNTDLQVSYNFNMVAIADMRPQQVGLIQILKEYIKHQEDVVLRRSRFDLNKAKKRLHIVEGLIKALSILDKVIKTIRSSKNKSDAKNNLIESYKFSDEQAEAIVSLQLYRLTNTDVTELEKEDAELHKQIDHLNGIIDNHTTLMTLIKKELTQVRDTYADKRRTKIEAKVAEIEVDTKVMVASEDVRLLVSHDGYVKRSSLRSYQASDAGDNGLKNEDYPIIDENVNTLDHVFIFTDKGNLIYRQIFEIEDSRWKDTGSHLSQEIGLDTDESILKAFVFKKLEEETGNFLIGTNENYIKQVAFSDLLPGRTYKSRASKYCKLKADTSRVMDVYYVPNDSKKLVYVFTEHSYASAFPIEEVPVVSGKAMGVKFVSLKDDDQLAGYFLATNDNDKIAVLTQRGSYKQMKLSEIPVTSRARRGVLTLRELKRQPHRICLVTNISNDIQLSIVTDSNKEIEIDPSMHQNADRYSNGSFIMDPETDGTPLRFVKKMLENE
ncbi:DNA topoisomerase IV subunit A [Companilactobacillus kimchii]|uniref:DNA topoisomerase 4 subunit A n=2 Tax=Companilactobacillus kimchii TaxID=2801452 RepID=A0ABR5NT22_9LACO|nr:DNA topoisomerase IV subunit A [Companilactobacillus kimchii]KRK51313.1 DNA topoisomerase IV subunit A [Companilactobacillus kimchii DSM 13961 = JCM 10707]OWF34206.1 DNA topoisomerase (ATP-hydrolyzing) [Companilactobacillus kimchii]GEO46119.1 DNA topoisomerase 4 subunit A [Companilactobacillus paralimentarius]